MTPLPHGGRLVPRRVEGEEAAALKRRAASFPSLILDAVALSDLEMFAGGGFSPLIGFMGTADYERVLAEMRLARGQLWPLPITLAVRAEEAKGLRPGQEVALRDARGRLRGIMKIGEVFPWSPVREAKAVFGTTDENHPGIKRLFTLGDRLVGGEVRVFPRSGTGPWTPYLLDPSRTRAEFARRGWRTVAGFQSPHFLHRGNEYLQKVALEMVDGLLLHPVVGATPAEDLPSDLRLRCYEVLLANYFPAARVILAAMPGAIRYAGPREAVLQAIVAKNYGCSHLIMSRDRNGGRDFPSPSAVQEIFNYFGQEELGIKLLFFDQAFYCRVCGGMATRKTCPHGPTERVELSRKMLWAMLARGEAPPAEFIRPEVAAVLLAAAAGKTRFALSDMGPPGREGERRVLKKDATLATPSGAGLRPD
ncbi:MAG: sulfate adenylyltransferase [Firmicutes bacterium]|nr:sulfate adenylyltransferase [Bacillota bacterium]